MAGRTFKNIKLITLREFKARVTRKAFKISTRFMFVIALLVPSVPVLITYFTSGDSQTRAAILDQAGTIAGQSPAAVLAYFNQSLNATGPKTPTAGRPDTKPAFVVSLADSQDKAAQEQKVRAGQLDALLYISRDSSGQLTYSLTLRKTTGDPLAAQFEQAANNLAIQDRLQAAGLSLDQQQQAFNPPAFEITSTEAANQRFVSDKNGSQYFTNYTICIVMIMLVLFGINLYGTWIAQGVVEEKTSRVMEVMLKATTPEQLMFGKILGVGAVGLSQFAILDLGYFIGTQLQGKVSEVLLGASGANPLDVAGSMGLILASLVLFVLGFFLYATVYAGLASLVGRQDEVQQAVAPVYYLITLIYLASFTALNSPDELWVRVLSFVPFFSPLFMIVRLGLGQVSAVEVVIAIGLTLAVIFVMGLLGAALYRRGILYYGRRKRLLSFLRQNQA